MLCVLFFLLDTNIIIPVLVYYNTYAQFKLTHTFKAGTKSKLTHTFKAGTKSKLTHTLKAGTNLI